MPDRRAALASTQPWHIVIIISIVTLYSLGGHLALAQPGQEAGSEPGGKTKIFELSGDVGTYGELYDISGRDRRRPSSSGRLFLNSTLSVWKSLTLNSSFALSTEGSSRRQDINRIDFNPSWSWGEVHIGDFAETYTPLTLSGVRIRGGSLMLKPGKFRFSLIGGRTQRAVSAVGHTRAYDRELYGGSVGYGRHEGSHVALTVIAVRDMISSLEDTAPDTALVPDTSAVKDSIPQVGSLNPFAVKPQENAVVSLATGLVFGQRRFTWRGEVSVGAITRDRRSPEKEIERAPEFLKDLFTPRLSTSLDYAITTELKTVMKSFDLKAGYEYIGPGYISLGLASLIQDKQLIRLGTSYRFGLGSVHLDLSHQNDNLIGQKAHTTDRNRIAPRLNLRPTGRWSFSVSGDYTTMKNNAPVAARLVDYSNLTVRTNQSLKIEDWLRLSRVSLSHTFQRSENKNPVRETAGNDAHTTALRLTFRLMQDLTFGPSLSLRRTKVGERAWMTTQVYGLSSRFGGLKRKLAVNAQAGLVRTDESTSLRGNLKVDYRLGSHISMNGELRMTEFSSDMSSGDFSERIARLGISRRF
jgi:hypothetical protein